MYAFLTNQSALEALRFLGGEAFQATRWPQTPRKLPRWGDCVTRQRDFKAYLQQVDLASYGVTSVPVHLLVPEASSRSRGKQAHFHVWKQPVPAQSLLRLDENLLVCSPEFVLVQMAAYNHKSEPVIERFHEESEAAKAVQAMADPDQPAPYDDPFAWARKERLVRMALLVCELAGSYRLPVGEEKTQYGLPALANREQFGAFADDIPHLYGASRVHKALDLAFDRSASPMETALALMLTLPVEFGGYGLPRPTLNEKLPTEGFAELWDGGDYITPDLLWKGVMLVIEYESDEFHEAPGRPKATDDATRANVLSAMGYSVLRATTGSVTSQVELDRLAKQVAHKLGVTLIAPDDVTLIRRHKLHSLLMHQ